MADTSRVGAKLGTKVAMLVSQAIVVTHAKLLHVKHRLAMMIFHAISDEISEEVDVTLGPFLEKLHNEIAPDHPAYPGVHFMYTATGQLKALAGTGLQISGLLGSISAIMNNELADIVYNVIRANPALLPDPATIVQSYAADLVSNDEAMAGIAAQGIQHGWAQRMLTLGFSYPSAVDGLEMVRRGLITADEAQQWMILNGVPNEVTGYFIQMINGPVSVADAALAVLRGNISLAEGQQIATQNGYSNDSFNIIINNTGEPPGLEQLLEAYRRNFIDQATLERGILESRYRDEWIPMLEELRYSPMSVADAVNAVVQSHMDQPTAETIAEQNGLIPGALDILIQTAGEPLSRTELEELYNRGLIDQATVEQGLRESRLKEKYVSDAFELHTKLLPIFTVQNALRRGGMTQEQAVKTMMEQGYSETDATEIVTSANAELLQTYRDKVVAAVTALYEDNLISETTALAEINSLGYTASQTQYIVAGSELRREAKTLQTAVNAVRAKFLAHHIDSNTASSILDTMQVPAAQRDMLIALWEIEIGAFTRTLTEAQIVKAVTLTLITADDGLARLIALGYNQGDAELLLNGA